MSLLCAILLLQLALDAMIFNSTILLLGLFAIAILSEFFWQVQKQRLEVKSGNVAMKHLYAALKFLKPKSIKTAMLQCRAPRD